MKYMLPPIIGFLISLSNLFCPFIVPFLLPFAKWDKEPSADQWGKGSVIRGDLPKWCSWFSTPDERLPGGMYEQTVADMYIKYGKWITSWYWLGIRNCLMGAATSFGKPADDYIPELPTGFWERETDGIWRYSKFIGPFKFVMGYQVYRKLSGGFQAAPVFTIKYRPNEKRE